MTTNADRDREAFEAWWQSPAQDELPAAYENPHDFAKGVWQAALTHARARAEPVAWMRDEESITTNEEILRRWRDAGRNVTALYTHPVPAQEPVAVPADVVRLVLAARDVAFTSDPTPEALKELDTASMAFAERIPWDYEPQSEEAAAPVAPPGESGEVERLREALETTLSQYRLFVGPDDDIANSVIALAEAALASHTPAPQPGGVVDAHETPSVISNAACASPVSDKQPGGAVKVKALEWGGPGNRHIRKSVYYTTWSANSIFGTYEIHYVEHCETPNRGYLVLPHFDPYYRVLHGGPDKHPTLESAKAAVWERHKSRILSALEPAPAPTSDWNAEAMREACAKIADKRAEACLGLADNAESTLRHARETAAAAEAKIIAVTIRALPTKVGG